MQDGFLRRTQIAKEQWGLKHLELDCEVDAVCSTGSCICNSLLLRQERERGEVAPRSLNYSENSDAEAMLFILHYYADKGGNITPFTGLDNATKCFAYTAL